MGTRLRLGPAQAIAVGEYILDHYKYNVGALSGVLAWSGDDLVLVDAPRAAEVVRAAVARAETSVRLVQKEDRAWARADRDALRRLVVRIERLAESE